MADTLCPKCGRENPASLSVCQFCQAPLPSESTLRIGEKPTKRNTGELEPVLPDWLRDLQKQSKDSAEKEAASAASMPKVQKAEPPDFLAGLASQSTDADEEDIPDWLKSLSPKTDARPASSDRPASTFFASSGQEVFSSKSEPESPPPPSASSEQDELSEWFVQASEQPAEPFVLDSDSPPIDLGWDFSDETPPTPRQEASPQPEEDLSWLHSLEAESKKTGEFPTPGPNEDWSSGFEVPAGPGASGQDNLGWLDELGSLPAAQPPKPEPSRPGEDLSWLSAFTDTPQAPPPASSVPASQDDLSWLDDLGALPSASESVPQPPRPKDDLSWLDAFPERPIPPQNVPAPPAASPEDLSWLRELDGISQPSQPAGLEESPSEQRLPGGTAQPQELPKVPPFPPRRTAPLGDEADASIPDWLKSATEEPSLPLGPQALDQIRDDKTTAGLSALAAASIFGAADQPPGEAAAPAQPEVPAGEPASLFSQDVDSIFSQGMPDWLARPQPEASQPVEDIGIHAEGGETLSPADLPTWVQAMRPVEAAITEAGPGLENQPVEREGPLAGLKGVIPAAAIGSLRRPHPIPLTLQASAEQQASAGILEQLLLAETTSRSVASVPVMASQRTLRWVIAGLLLFVLAAVIFSGTQSMPVSPALPPAASDAASLVMGMADNAPILVIMDYQPSLAGEMEAVSGPLLDQMVQLHHPVLSFVATSPSGNALVERLLQNTSITRPDGTGYVAGQNYNNLGYLPGGEAGALSFLQSQQSAYAAILLLTDHAESARSWVEQLDTMKQLDPSLAGQPLIALTSAQAGPMLQPYYSSGQIDGLINGLPIAARYEMLNANRPGTARSYWDAFGAGMMMAVMLIVLGSLWSLYSGYRARSAQTEKE